MHVGRRGQYDPGGVVVDYPLMSPNLIDFLVRISYL